MIPTGALTSLIIWPLQHCQKPFFRQTFCWMLKIATLH